MVVGHTLLQASNFHSDTAYEKLKLKFSF